jgi:hypothetical protein
MHTPCLNGVRRGRWRALVKERCQSPDACSIYGMPNKIEGQDITRII